MNMILLVGPIASGKSTYARERALGGALVVNDDSLVTSVHGGWYGGYATGLKPLYVTLETAIITHAAGSGRDVVIDRGCRNKATRARFAALGRSLGFTIYAKEFPWEAAEVHATRRFAHDPRGLTWDRWFEVANQHEMTFEPVNYEAEGLYRC